MKLGPIWLRVRKLDLTLSFYLGKLGLTILRKSTDSEGEVAELSAGQQTDEPLIVLRHDPKARDEQHNAAGLYHYAILLPNRKDLAEAYKSLANAGVAFEGFSDHLVSEALYLSDPEGNGIEIYADRPRDKWKFDQNGHVRMDTRPVDMESLLSELSGERSDDRGAVPGGAKIGHVHLKVTNLNRSSEFYRNVLGFDLMSERESAAFLSVARYHHHIGMNVWESLGGPPRTDGYAGLEHFTILVPEQDFVDKLSANLNETSVSVQRLGPGQVLVRDPDGIKAIIKGPE